MSFVLDRTARKRDFYLTGPAWVRSVWPTPHSFEWFCKSRRQELARQGAMVKLGRDWFIDCGAFPQAVASVYGLPVEAVSARQGGAA
jgi:hypothetical protein